ncbi:MAG: hypothetical protein F4W68_03670 [Cenarchaeum sp. SB0661_bin_35]|nr:hypothetical protein [Cenarchaeum sp. SB0667_bin_13]MXZ92984.1 hypothetical protein [Cenarchaeum sp. SB0666_bin_15]MYC79584.1 hypothetical protein [Cenarchaeum sp. SB0661_bin_35]MYD59112.1 hypothetical protein [Cenarchaeum sp. SB0678_bin_8]MYI52162.1 hypothetical protein [Cenarchaeum sp. SB0673_bin_9]MYJ27373.1 hypothetical protein [Cenarchaeum sp. SB0672_bin_9]
MTNCAAAAFGSIDVRRRRVRGVRSFRTGLRRGADGWALLYLSFVTAFLAIFFLLFGMSAEMSAKRRYQAKHGTGTMA